jgi:hypothetical protein
MLTTMKGVHPRIAAAEVAAKVSGMPDPVKSTAFQDYQDKNASYWRVWKEDVNTLEDASASILVKKIMADQRSLDGGGKKRVLKNADGTEMSGAAKARVRALADKYYPQVKLKDIERIWNSDKRLNVRYPVAEKVRKGMKGGSFAPPVHPDAGNRSSLTDEMFDYDYNGSAYADVPYYFSEGGLGSRLPHPLAGTSLGDPNNIGGANTQDKGFPMAAGAARGAVPRCETTTCDIVDLAGLNRKSLGSSFSSAKRFRNADGASGGGGGGETVYTPPDMGHTTKYDKLDAPGPTFLTAKREGGPMKQEDVTLRIPVEPTSEAHRLDIEATIAKGLPPPTELVQVCLSSNVYY